MPQITQKNYKILSQKSKLPVYLHPWKSVKRNKHTPPPWTQDVNSMYIRRSEDVQDVWWTFYVRSIYVLSRKDNISNNVDYKSSYSNECMHCKYVSIYQHACIYQHFHCSVVCLVLHSNVFFCFSLEIWDGTFCENSFH